MKIFFVVAFFSCILTVALAGTCAEQAECAVGQCCAGLPFFQFFGVPGGNCRPLTPAGGKCKVTDKVIPLYGDMYVGSTCPCGEGLVCVQVKKNNGICQAPPTTVAPEPPVTSAAPDVSEEPASSAAPEVPDESNASNDESASSEEPTSAGDSASVEEPASSGESASAEVPASVEDSASADESASNGESASEEEAQNSESSAAE